MAKTVGDFVVERVRAWGVERVFGYPGDGINGIMAGFEHLGGEGPRFIQARHEELAAFMAGAHAKFTGEVGVCLATSGPGAIHLLNGLYDAAMDHQPVVAIVGQSATTAMGGEYQQEVDLQVLFKDVAHNYVTTVSSPGSVRHANQMKSESWAPVVKTLLPLTTYSSPSRTALVCSEPRSEPAPGSE